MPETRLTVEADVVTVESDSLYVALTTLAQHIRGARSFTINGTRIGSGWTVRAAATAAIPAQRAPECCGPWYGHGHAPTCEVAAR